MHVFRLFLSSFFSKQGRLCYFWCSLTFEWRIFNCINFCLNLCFCSQICAFVHKCVLKKKCSVRRRSLKFAVEFSILDALIVIGICSNKNNRFLNCRHAYACKEVWFFKFLGCLLCKHFQNKGVYVTFWHIFAYQKRTFNIMNDCLNLCWQLNKFVQCLEKLNRVWFSTKYRIDALVFMWIIFNSITIFKTKKTWFCI